MGIFSESRSSSFSFSRDNESSFRTSSSSSHNSTHGQEMIPCSSHHHSYYVTTLRASNHHHITCLTVHGNILYAASGNDINAFDLSTLTQIPNTSFFDGRDLSSGGFIKSIAFHVDNILTAHQDGKIRVWKRHRLVATLPTIKDKLSRFLSPKSYVQVRRNKKKLWIEHNDAVSGLAVNEKEGLIYSVSWDKTVKIWRGSDFKCLESLTAHGDAVNAVRVSTASACVYTGSADGLIRVWVWERGSDRVLRHHMVDTLEKHSSTVNALALSKDGRVLLSGGGDGMIVGWERNDGDDRMAMSGVVGGHDGAVLCLINFGMDGRDLFVSGSADRTVRIWGRGRDGRFCCLGVLEGHKRPVRSLAVKEENDVVLVFSGSLDGEIKIWQVNVNQLN